MFDLQTAQIVIAVLVVIIILLLWKMYMPTKSSYIPESRQSTGQSGGAGAKFFELSQIGNGETPFSFKRSGDLLNAYAYAGIPNPNFPRANVLIDSSAWADAEDELQQQVSLGNDLSYAGVEDSAFRAMWSIAEGPTQVAREVQKRVGGMHPGMNKILSDPGVAAAMASDPNIARSMQHPAVIALSDTNPAVVASIIGNPLTAVSIANQADNTTQTTLVANTGMPTGMADASIGGGSH